MNDSPTYESFRVDRRGHVTELVMCRPDAGNTMGGAFWRELPLAVAEADEDDECRVILLRAEGKNFSFGLDLMSIATDLGPMIIGKQMAAGRTRLLRLIERWQVSVSSLARAHTPVVGAVQGWCIGGGLDVISACDVRVCSAGARFSLRETKMAIVADLGSLQRLPGIIGHAATAEMGLTGGDVHAERALRLGLVSEIFEDPEALLAGARALADEIAGNPPLVVQGVKRVLAQARREEIQGGLDYVAAWNSAFVQSEDLVEALAAFAEKRQPEWKGR